MSLAKVLEFIPPMRSYLAFVSLREKILLTRFMDEHVTKSYFVDEGGDTIAIQINLSRFMLERVRREFPNLHIIEGSL